MQSRRITPTRFPPVPNRVTALADSIENRQAKQSHSDDPSGAGHSETHGRFTHSPRTTLWLRRADQLLLGFLLVALLTLLIAFRWKLSGGGRGEIEIVSQQPREYFYTIDVNNASWVEWAQLDGIGEKLARRIVKDREDHGSFDSIDGIRRVRGLGPKLVEKLRPFLKCGRDQSQKTLKELR